MISQSGTQTYPQYQYDATNDRNVGLELMAQYGAFLSQSTIEDFNNYASVVFQQYGKKMRTWVTFNEPQVCHIGFDPD